MKLKDSLQNNFQKENRQDSQIQKYQSRGGSTLKTNLTILARRTVAIALMLLTAISFLPIGLLSVQASPAPNIRIIINGVQLDTTTDARMFYQGRWVDGSAIMIQGRVMLPVRATM